ncbi:MAG: alpha/beta hydrolase family protein [Sandaracinaceae bacterium]|nr:alpha/beta hydrolase family protein [Sandaracinaceae bacterium]
MRLLDRLYVRVTRPLGCFEAGWGEPSELDRPLSGEGFGEPTPIAPRWTRKRVHGELCVLDGELESPEERLPLESGRRACACSHLERSARAPSRCASRRGTTRGFAARQRLLAPAASAGVACLLLENAFYGGRRRVGQRGSRLATVSDFVVMGRATVREAHALVAWARAEGYARTGVAGYSMGGQMAAMSAALAPWPVHVAAMAPAVTPASVFLHGPLRRDVAWRALGEGGERRLERVLTSLSVLGLPPVAAPHLATLVGTRHDAIVPPGDVAAIARHWRVSPRWLDDGHVSAIALRSRALAQAVVDTFARR